MTTFYEGDEGGLVELPQARYRPMMDDQGRWAIHDRRMVNSGGLMSGLRHATFESAEAMADLYNAVEEDQPPRVIDDLRADLDRVRAMAPMPTKKEL